MPVVSFKKKDVPFLLGGAGEFAVETGNLQLNQPLPENTVNLLSLGFKAGGERQIALGQENSVKLGVSTEASVNLIPIFAGSNGPGAKLLRDNGLAGFFHGGANGGKVILGLDIGASGDVSAAGSFTYSVLKASVQVDAGADGGYSYLRALDKTLPVQDLLVTFFKSTRLPEQGDRAPDPGEAIALRYGGYLRLSADVSAGYRLAGTKSFSLGQMVLSENYDLSILGKVGLSAGVAGRFSILVTAGEKADWARVEVRRHRSKDLRIAADVNVAFKNQLEGLPDSADEFLGAALGVNAKNFLTVFQKARELSDFNKFKETVDGLAKKFIGEFIGKAFDKLETATEFTKFLARVNKVVTSYEQLEDRAITLFDRYFDKVDQLTAFLDRIVAATSLEPLTGKLDPVVWNMLSQLTGGDPLGFMLGQVTIGGKKLDSLVEIKKRAQATLDLIRDDAHAEIRELIGIAKRGFGVDMFFRELAKVDTVDELQALANDKVGLFVTRLVGRGLDSNTNIKAAFQEVRAVLDRIDGFKNTLFQKFREAASASYKVALHAEYSRASERDSLVDVEINLGDVRGKDLLSAAGKGDFEKILSVEDPGLVKLREGVLTHRTRRESAFRVNIVGWHLNYNYEGFDRVITETEQRLVPSDQGITIFTTATLNVERERKRNDEEMHINFLLRALGESAKVIKSDSRNLGYLIETLSSLTARYELSFTDQDTSEGELRDYLAFAKDLGLDKKGATLDDLRPLLPRAANGGFGDVSTSYDVRFGSKAIDALLSMTELSEANEAAVRRAMRRMVLANYLKNEGMHDIAFAYASPAHFKRFMQVGFAAFIPPSPREVPIAIEIAGIAAPAKVTLSTQEFQVLVTLYNIENSMIKAIQDLVKILGGKKAIKPDDFAKKLDEFGDALKNFDKFDQASRENEVGSTTIFAMFDMLVRLASQGDSAVAATLTLRSQAGGKDVEKVFLTDGAATDAGSQPTARAAAGGR